MSFIIQVRNCTGETARVLIHQTLFQLNMLPLSDKLLSVSVDSSRHSLAGREWGSEEVMQRGAVRAAKSIGMQTFHNTVLPVLHLVLVLYVTVLSIQLLSIFIHYPLLNYNRFKATCAYINTLPICKLKPTVRRNKFTPLLDISASLPTASLCPSSISKTIS